MKLILIICISIIASVNVACSSCFGIRMITKEPRIWGGVKFSDGTELGENGTAPPTMACFKMPESAIFFYSFESARSDRNVDTVDLPPIAIKDKMPKNFMSNPARLLYLELDKNRQPVVLFNMKLSEYTTKLIAHDETPEEKQQRLKDERFFLGIKNQNVLDVTAALAEGASVIQPWIRSNNFHEDRYNIWAIYDLAMATENSGIINAVLNHKAPFRDRLAWSALYHDYEVRAPNKNLAVYIFKPRYVSNQIADILLANGANPNYGVSIYFNWNEDPELEKRPDMPRFARYKDAPIDRLIYTAVAQNNIELLKVLLKHGAETRFRLPASRTPPEWWKEGEWFLDWAKRDASLEIKKILKLE